MSKKNKQTNQKKQNKKNQKPKNQQENTQTHTPGYIFGCETVRVGGKSAGCSSSGGLLGAMLSFPPGLRSVQRGCQVHSVTRASAERTGRSSIDSERVTAPVCGTSRAHKNKSSVQGVRQEICGRQILLLRRRGGPLDCGV